MRLGNDRRSLRQNALQPSAALVERQRALVGAVSPEDVEGHVTGAPRHAEQLVEPRSAGLVSHDHLAVDYRVVDVEHSCHLRAERLETAQDVAVARDEAATALLDVAQRTWLTRPADRGSTSCSACRGAPATWPS